MYRRLIAWSRSNALARLAYGWIAPETRRKFVRALGSRDRASTVNKALAGHAANLDDIEMFLLSQPLLMRAPLVLISQAHRSGGTLLSQLFDGHPALAAHPHELKIGHPTPEDWPRLDPARGADANFRLLFEPRSVRFLRDGYQKGEQGDERLPFFNVPHLQYRIFASLFAAQAPRDERAILDCYFTAYFRAWLNYQGDLTQKRWVTAFAPRFADGEESVARFFECYPDGRLIQIVRDPATWLPSALHHEDRATVPKLEDILQVWCKSARSVVRNKGRYGDRVIVLRFEDLVGRVESTMRYLARELGIEFQPVLLEPSFNGAPMRANSSFSVERSGVIAAPLSRASLLSDAERRLIEERCRGLHEVALATAARIAA